MVPPARMDILCLEGTVRFVKYRVQSALGRTGAMERMGGRGDAEGLLSRAAAEPLGPNVAGPLRSEAKPWSGPSSPGPDVRQVSSSAPRPRSRKRWCHAGPTLRAPLTRSLPTNNEVNPPPRRRSGETSSLQDGMSIPGPGLSFKGRLRARRRSDHPPEAVPDAEPPAAPPRGRRTRGRRRPSESRGVCTVLSTGLRFSCAPVGA